MPFILGSLELQTSAGSIPSSVGIGVNWELIQNTQKCRFMGKEVREISRFLLHRHACLPPPPSEQLHALPYQHYNIGAVVSIEVHHTLHLCCNAFTQVLKQQAPGGQAERPGDAPSGCPFLVPRICSTDVKCDEP